MTPPVPTVLSIAGETFRLNGRPTYPGVTYAGRSLEGRLCAVRAAQATFDDENWPATRHYDLEVGRRSFAYPDTGTWDPERNVDEFCAALPAWRAHGINAVVVAFQGGRPVRNVWKGRTDAQPWVNTGFSSNGALKPASARRMARVLGALDRLGMVAVVSLFYFGQTPRLADDAAIRRAVREATEFLAGLGRANMILEIAQEVVPAGTSYHYPQFSCLALERVHGLVALAQDVAGRTIPVSTSLISSALPTPELVRTADLVLPHGNNRGPEGHRRIVEHIRNMPAWRDQPKPIFFNEASPDLADFEIALAAGASWSFYDHGENDYVNGFQSPPVNWSINTPVKRAYFERVRAITTGSLGRQ